MDIQATKIKLIHLLLNTNEVEILQQLKEVFEKKSPDIWDELNDLDKAAINEGLEQLDKGQYVSHESVKDAIEAKYNF
ncbi:MAG: hypothetical protein WD048_13390 [Chitinophagales bacterium]